MGSKPRRSHAPRRRFDHFKTAEGDEAQAREKISASGFLHRY
jgi:hypothetical protein